MEKKKNNTVLAFSRLSVSPFRPNNLAQSPSSFMQFPGLPDFQNIQHALFYEFEDEIKLAFPSEGLRKNGALRRGSVLSVSSDHSPAVL